MSKLTILKQLKWLENLLEGQVDKSKVAKNGLKCVHIGQILKLKIGQSFRKEDFRAYLTPKLVELHINTWMALIFSDFKFAIFVLLRSVISRQLCCLLELTSVIRDKDN